jgi:hypothetical protein
MLKRRDESGSVAAVTTQPIDVYAVLRIPGLVVDLEIDCATNICADTCGKALN